MINFIRASLGYSLQPDMRKVKQAKKKGLVEILTRKEFQDKTTKLIELQEYLEQEESKNASKKLEEVVKQTISLKVNLFPFHLFAKDEKERLNRQKIYAEENLRIAKEKEKEADERIAFLESDLPKYVLVKNTYLKPTKKGISYLPETKTIRKFEKAKNYIYKNYECNSRDLHLISAIIAKHSISYEAFDTALKEVRKFSETNFTDRNLAAIILAATGPESVKLFEKARAKINQHECTNDSDRNIGGAILASKGTDAIKLFDKTILLVSEYNSDLYDMNLVAAVLAGKGEESIYDYQKSKKLIAKQDSSRDRNETTDIYFGGAILANTSTKTKSQFKDVNKKMNQVIVWNCEDRNITAALLTLGGQLAFDKFKFYKNNVCSDNSINVSTLNYLSGIMTMQKKDVYLVGLLNKPDMQSSIFAPKSSYYQTLNPFSLF